MNNKFFGFLSFTGIISFFSYIYFHQKNKIKELEKLLNRDVKFNMDIIEIKNHTTEEINPNLIYDDDDSNLINNLINNIEQNKNILAINDINKIYQILDSIKIQNNDLQDNNLEQNETSPKKPIHLEIEYDNSSGDRSCGDSCGDSGGSSGDSSDSFLKENSYDKLTLSMVNCDNQSKDN